MATKKISELPAASVDLVASDLIEVSKGGSVSQKLSGTQLANGVKTVLNLAPVAISGVYNDLTGKPTVIPEAPSDSKAYGRYNAGWQQVVLFSTVGAAGGVAQLDGSGKVPAAQLPSYVDDVLEYANLAAFPATGETGKIYIALDTNQQYRWSGSAYVALSSSPGGAVWGSITGTLSAQTDLQTALNGKEPTITAGSTDQYIRGDKTLSNFGNDVRATPLTGLNTSLLATITASDTMLSAPGKLQAQVSNNDKRIRALGAGTATPGLLVEHQITDTNFPWFATQNIDFRLQRLNATTLRILQTGPVYFSQDVFDPAQAEIVTFAQQDVALSTIPGLSTDGIYLLHVNINKAGTLSYTATSQSTSISLVQLGLIVVKRVSGVVSFLEGTNGVDNPVMTMPNVVAVDNLLRTISPLKSTLKYLPVGGNLQIKNAVGAVIGEGANWGDDTNAHKKVVAAANPAEMRYVHSASTLGTSLAAKVTVMDPANYFNGSAVVAVGGAATAATVQRLVVNATGNLLVQYGEVVYTDLAAAVAAIDTAPFAASLPETFSVEVARVALRKTCTNLADTTQAQFAYGSGAGGSGGGLSDAPIDGNTYGRKDGSWSVISTGGAPAWGTITGSLSAQTDLQTALNGKQALHANLTAISGLSTAADKITYWTGSGTAALTDFSSFARTLLDDADAATARATLGAQASLGYTAENTANKGVANGYASLDSGGKVPAAQLPAYVDDVLEYANLAAFPATGSSGVIYVADDTGKIYRWSGSAYIEISPSPGSTDSVTEGSTNLYFTETRVRDTLLTGLSTASNTSITASDSMLTAPGKLQAQITGLGSSKQDLDSDLTAIAGLSTNGLIERTGTGTAGIVTITAAGKALLDDADAAAQRTTLGLATVASTGAYADLTGKPTVLPDAPADGTTYGRKDNAWVAVAGGGGSSTFSGLSDVSVGTPANGYTVIYDSTTGKYTVKAQYSHSTTSSSPRGLTVADANTIIHLQNASSSTVTIPLNSTQAIPIGVPIILHQDSAAAITLSFSGGVTFTTGSLTQTYAQGDVLILIKRATDTWDTFYHPANPQQKSVNLTAIANQTTAANKISYWNGVGTAALSDFTAQGRNLVGALDPVAAQGVLGLGTIATQNSNSVSITGGGINGATIGNSSRSTGKFTDLDANGDLTLSGSGKRIFGDFSNATPASRVLFQTNIVNGATGIGVIPNGTSPTSVLNLYGASDPANASIAQLQVNASAVNLVSTAVGSGTALPLTVAVGSIGERFRIPVAENRFQADFSNATVTNRLHLQTSAVNSATTIGILPNGTGVASALNFNNTQDPVNTSQGQIVCNNAAFAFRSNGIGSGTLLPITFEVATERGRFGTDGTFSVGTTSNINVAGDSKTGVQLAINGSVFSGGLTSAALYIKNQPGGASTAISFFNSTAAVGSITTTGSATAYNTSSDYRLKENQEALTGSGEFIDALQPKTWTWKSDGSRGVGFIAHEVQLVSPGSVAGEKDATKEQDVLDEAGEKIGTQTVPDYQAMEYGSAEFIANIIAELQSLRRRVAELEARP